MSRNRFLLLSIFVLLVVLRFWKSAEWFSFNFDEEYQALLAWAQVKDFHPIWIGVSASNFGYYLGPAFTYLNAILFWISRGDLTILAYFASLFGIITTLSLYYVASVVYSKKVGLISAVLYGFSALMIYFDHRFWNPTPIAFVTIWLLFSLQKAIKDSRWFILSAILMAASLHIHLSLMVYWPILLYRVTREFKKISFKTWLLAILSYIVVVSPLIVFDFTHNFDDLLGPVRYLFSQKTSGSVFGLDQLIYHLKNVWLSLGKLLTLNFFTTIQDEHGLGVHAVMTKPSFLLSFFSLATLVWYFIKCIWERHISILLVMVSSILLFYLIYPSIGCEYYLLGFFTLMTIVIALFLDAISWKILTPLLGAFILYNTVTVFTTDQAKYGLLARRNLINQVMLEVRESSFRMETIGKDPRPYHSYGGWRYLFQTYGSRPVSSPADEFFGWIYPDEILGNKPLYKVVISEQVMQDCYVKCTSVTSGAFTAYIFQLN